MASGPITSWQKEWEKVEAVTDFLFLGSKITVVSDCSYEIKRLFILGRKAMENLDKHIKKQRYHFANKDLHSQSYGFSSSHVWMWELDHKVAMLSNCGCQRRLLIVPWAERRLNQSILKEINPEYSLEGLMLKQKLRYFGHLMQIANSLDKTHLGKIEGKRRRGWQRLRWHHPLNGHEFEQTLRDSERQKPGMLQFMGLQRVRHDLAMEQQQNLILSFPIHDCHD